MMKSCSPFRFNPYFFPFFWVQFLGALTDNVIKNMLVILIAYKSVQLYGLGSESLIAVASALFILPFVLFSPLAGGLADSLSKVKILKITKWTELFIMLLATLGFYLDQFSILLFSLFLMGAQSTFFGPVKYGIIPSLVSKSDLVAANAMVEMGTFLAILIGTILGGLLVQVDHWLVLGGSVSFLSFIGVVFSFFQEDRKGYQNSLQQKRKPVSIYTLFDYKDLFYQMSSQPNLSSVVLLISCFWFFGAGLLTLLPTYCVKVLNVNENVVTLFLATFTLGIGLGSLVCGWVSQKKVALKWVSFGFFGVFLFVSDFFWAHQGWNVSSEVLNLSQFLSLKGSFRFLLDFILISFFGGFFIVPLYSYLQEQAQESTLSRVIAANNILNAVFMVLVSVIIIGFSQLGLEPVTSLFLIGCLFFLCSLFLFFGNSNFKNSFFGPLGLNK